MLFSEKNCNYAFVDVISMAQKIAPTWEKNVPGSKFVEE